MSDEEVETPGEDPYHLSSYVHALIDGLQGGYDPKYKRVVATCKHFAGQLYFSPFKVSD